MSGASTPWADGHDSVFDRPVILLSPPRSGSTLLFETLARSPDLHTIGGESHRLIESIPSLQVGRQDSNRLVAADATPEVVHTLRERFRLHARDRSGRAPTGRFRLLEKTPKNALRIPFLRQVFPEARFVYLHRDPRQVMASMIDAWRSGRFRTYLDLAGWPHPAWSLVLVPGWQALADKPLEQVVAAQWDTVTRVMLDDLAQVPADRWCSVRYDALAGDAAQSVPRLCDALDIRWDAPLAGGLRPSRNTLTPPDPDKWKRHAGAIEPLLPALAATIERAERMATSALGRRVG